MGRNCFAVITGCSNRKRIPPLASLVANSLPSGSLEEVACAWRRRVDECSRTVRVRDLYSGRGFSEIRKVAESVEYPFWVVSAGFGLVKDSDAIQSYDLTLSLGSANSLVEKVDPHSFTASQWWALLHGPTVEKLPISELMAQAAHRLCLVALSSQYLELVSEDLCSAPSDHLQKLRIFTRATLPPTAVRLDPYVLAYDDRLDGPDSPIPGTKNDFAQRALRHFVEHILPRSKDGNIERHQQLVRTAWENARAPKIPTRRRLSDAEIMKIIVERLSSVEGSSSRMLRLLRDEEKVSCEQKRFSQIFKQAVTRIK